MCTIAVGFHELNACLQGGEFALDIQKLEILQKSALPFTIHSTSRPELTFENFYRDASSRPTSRS